MKRYLLLSYGIFAYVMSILTIAYSVGFLGNMLVVRTIDGAALIPMREALFVNVSLIIVFGLQHSGMARRPFKNWLHKRMNPCSERSTYVLAACVAMVIVMVFWQPMGGIVWAVRNQMLSRSITAIYFGGWALMLYATFLINHFELFGLQQAWTVFRRGHCWGPELKTPGLYRHVRHPIYLGWLLVAWATPIMTATHLVFAACITIYILIGIQLEERDLAAELPDYQQYKRKVPMLLPSWRKRLLQESDS